MSSSFINPLNYIKYFQEPKYTELKTWELVVGKFTLAPISLVQKKNLAKIMIRHQK